MNCTHTANTDLLAVSCLRRNNSTLVHSAGHRPTADPGKRMHVFDIARAFFPSDHLNNEGIWEASWRFCQRKQGHHRVEMRWIFIHNHVL